MRDCFLHGRFEEPNSSKEFKDSREAPEHFLADCGRNLKAMLALDTGCGLAVRKRWEPEEKEATFKEK